MSNVSDFMFYGGGGFGGINKGQESKTLYVPLSTPGANKLPNKLLRSLGPRVYKCGKSRAHKKKKTASKISKKHRRVSKKTKKQTKVKKVCNKKLKFQNF